MPPTSKQFRANHKPGNQHRNLLRHFAARYAEATEASTRALQELIRSAPPGQSAEIIRLGGLMRAEAGAVQDLVAVILDHLAR